MNDQESVERTRWPRRRWAVVGLGCIVLLALAAVAAGPIMSRVEQPAYAVTAAAGAIEIRDYGPMNAAEVDIRGERAAAISQGFALIAAYIFGANAPNATIAMTAPVQSQPQQPTAKQTTAQTIAMTAPVVQQGKTEGGEVIWSVRFIMPQKWTMDTLPKPKDAHVKLIHVAAKQLAVIRFSGTASDALIAEKTMALRKYVTDNKIAVVGEPVLAFYNPPWTLPLFRRNEIMLELAPGEARKP
jgi:hypothetical protein